MFMKHLIPGLVLASLIGCGSATDDPADSSTQAGPYEACAAETHVGSFEMTLKETFTSVQGTITNAVRPSDISEVTGSEDSCELLQPKTLFCDPMCGSGTIPIEAMMMSACIPSGYLRENFAFQNWRSYDEKGFTEIKNKYIEQINRSFDANIYGSDNTEKNIVLVKDSLERLGMEGMINLKVSDILDFKVSSEKGTIIMNPPHGLRMSNQQSLKALYQNIGDVLKKKCHNHDAYIFCMNNSLSKSVGLRTKKRYVLRNGKLDCRLLYYPMQEGKFS